MTQGIVVGSDQTQEWLLPWWWGNYTRHNRFPVVFIDFGLSDQMRQWCRDKGQLIRLPILFAKERSEIDPELAQQWEKYYGENFWTSRDSWFKKPHACLLSPFQTSIWMDLDCEILGHLAPLFITAEHPPGIALAKDQIVSSAYNSGVIAFQQNHPLLKEWAVQSMEQSGLHRSDQDLLSQIIFDNGIPIYELPSIYNWNVGFGAHPEALICHWLGEIGKIALRTQLTL